LLQDRANRNRAVKAEQTRRKHAFPPRWIGFAGNDVPPTFRLWSLQVACRSEINFRYLSDDYRKKRTGKNRFTPSVRQFPIVKIVKFYETFTSPNADFSSFQKIYNNPGLFGTCCACEITGIRVHFYCFRY
jgi:hypothetical protein